MEIVPFCGRSDVHPLNEMARGILAGVQGGFVGRQAGGIGSRTVLRRNRKSIVQAEQSPTLRVGASGTAAHRAAGQSITLGRIQA